MDSGINQLITDVMAQYINHISKALPDDVLAKLRELRDTEELPMAQDIYDAMFRNLELARELGRPMCQDTGIPQFWIKCGSDFPYIGNLESSIISAVAFATERTPLRPNAVEIFDDKNTGSNIATGAPVIWWDIVSGRDDCEIYTYLAGGGSSLPGYSAVFMPGQGCEAIEEMVIQRISQYGPNACPPLLVGVGIGMSAEVAAMNSKKALMRPVGLRSENESAAQMENKLEKSLNALGIAPAGLGGSNSVMGVNIVSTARHPATLGAALSIGCWCHRRGHIVFDKDLRFSTDTHSDFNL